jgi:hypothetical protein
MSNFHISIPVSGLIKREDYTYEIIGIAANWPSVASPASGTFTSPAKSTSINTTISFLPTTGSNTHLNVLPYNLLSCGYQDKEIFTRVAAKLTSQSDNSIIISDSKFVNCSGCLPSISISMSGCGATGCDQHSLTSGNIFDFVSSLSGLEPNTSYKYHIRSIGSNWPVIMMSPMSGAFASHSNTYTLKHKLAFCPYSDNLCGSGNVLDYDLAQCFNKNNLYTNIELSVAPDYCSEERTFSNNIFVNCKNCLPRIASSLPSKLSLTASNIVNITGSFSGLVSNTLYFYSFDCLDSNWPSLLKPISGSFVASSGTDNVISQLMFCSPSGDCVSGTEGLLPYSLDSSADKAFNQKKLHTDLRLTLTSECGDVVSSKKCSVECDNCLPCVRYANILFEGSPTIMLDSGCCQGQKLLRVNVNNAVAGDRYTYNFDSVNGIGVNSVVFNPSSGEIYFGSGGTGVINTICNVDLMDHAQTLLSCELTHDNTNSKVMDTVVLVCNNSEC